ncbi:hypothetical protein SULPSESMR1_01064 [Pseudosulfitobacter pseudonitzschiae]|uniref:Uncharacterized protein n=1 Tax=Pseudosulfitobacter pseudonitzschiae TaxID=1402135 RepID=A0A221JZ29_9RHOB|nr:hypothetical protein SULPSESMR1_01064 [Pseudosulfitobacter pseudonitzschiae]
MDRAIHDSVVGMIKGMNLPPVNKAPRSRFLLMSSPHPVLVAVNI